MGKTLIIAEKPSVASDFAKVLGKFKKEKDFFENDQYVISSAVGHLLSIEPPEGEEPKRGKWNLQNLPVIPTRFELKPIAKTEARLKVLKKLAGRKDVTSIINACDAGREGELIFRYLVQYLKTQKPCKRLWLQSMTPTAIRESFQKLLEDAELQPLADAATCRSESDWIVGINGTRALTAFNSKGGGFHKTTVGRVQTPTLAILVEREEKIRHFQSNPYWEIIGSFQAKAGEYEGRWFDENFKKPQAKDDDTKDLKAERLWDKAKAEAIVQACQGKPATVTEEKKPSQQLSPLLFDLTSLQREANARFSYPAKMTLAIAQSLYERHKAITYPRTDSRYLPEDYVGTSKKILHEMGAMHLGGFAKKILDQGWLKPNKRIFNQAKVSDHFAIIPTSQMPPASKLNETEQKIYDLIARRFLAVFYPPAVYEVTTRISRIEEHAFKTEGKILKELGWLEVYGKDSNGETLPPITSGETVQTESVELIALDTKPPARFSEATLLSAMEGAGKFVEDEELRDAMAEKGLGTPATRASIIENLIHESYVNREGRELIPTPKAFNLLETLRAMNIPTLSSPELTGEWEYKLKLIEKGKLTRPEFMDEIQGMTRKVIHKIKDFDPDSAATHETDMKDPFTGQPIMETLRDYRTPDGSLTIRKAIAGRIIEKEELRELLEKRTIGPLDGFRSKIGRPFSACLQLKDDKTIGLDWGGNTDQSDKIIPVNVIGICPKDKAEIFETDSAYICKNATGENKTCDFRVSKRILNNDISRVQAVKLLSQGKTDLLEGFISQRTRRPFKAYLFLKEDGKIGFEFPPREAKAPKGKAKGKAKKKSSASSAE